MKYTIEKTGRFEYAHRLPSHPRKCKNLHGHSAEFVVRIGGVSRLNRNAMVIDFGDLNLFIESMIDRYDHKTILAGKDKEIFQAEIAEEVIFVDTEPTAEIIATNILTSFYNFVDPRIQYQYLEVDFFEGPKSKITVRLER